MPIPSFFSLSDNFCYNTGANGTATFANRETQAFIHSNRVDQLHYQLNVIARHNHLYAFRQVASTGYVGGAEVELWTVAIEEWGMTTTFFFAQYVHFCFKVGVWLDRAWLSQYLTTLNVVTFGATQQHTHVLTRTTFVEQLAEHLNTRTSSLNGVANTDDFNFFTNLNDALLNRSEEHTSELQSRPHLVCRLLLEKKKINIF